MNTIFSPENFNTIPWKNGLGHTTELAISDGGNLDNFDWRLSIASVVNDGDFSNFAGYHRNLVLIEGNGLILDHRNGNIDKLTTLLDVAHFDGVSQTHGALVNGSIKDFNIMTKKTSFYADVNCCVKQQSITIELLTDDLLFAYSLTDKIMVNSEQDEGVIVPTGHLLKSQASNLSISNSSLVITITGKNMIIIGLKVKACL